MTPAPFHASYEAGMMLHASGIPIMPLPWGSKVPYEGRPWAHLASRPQSAHAAHSLLRPYAFDGCNIAMLCGQRTTRGRLFVAELDLDTMDDVDYRLRMLEKACAGRHPRIHQSARGLGATFKTQAPIASHRYPWGELRGRGAYVVLPPSRHPSGIDYTWQRKADGGAVLRNLGALREICAGADYAQTKLALVIPAMPTIGRVQGDPGDRSTLPYLAQGILNNDPATIAKYPARNNDKHTSDRSAVGFALCVSLTNHGLNAETIFRWMLQSAHEASWRDHKKADAQHAALWRDIHHAMQWATVNDSYEYSIAQNVAQDMRQDAWATPWPRTAGTQGESIRAAYLAHAETVARVGRLDYHLSQEAGGILARMGDKTFGRASRALASPELARITQTHKGDRATGMAARYSVAGRAAEQQQAGMLAATHDAGIGVSPKQKGVGAAIQTQAGVSPTERESVILHKRVLDTDAFEFFALGKSAGVVYVALLSGITTQAAIARHTGRNQSTVARALLRLEAAQLAQQTGQQRTRGRSVTAWAGIERDAAHLDSIALAYGTDGRGARRAADVASKQRAHKAYVQARTRKAAGAQLATTKTKARAEQ